ncbi:MAG: hypothetical protein AAGE84_03545 [Cyanobacteria bacterium P01_G01_bin.39]
MSLDQQFRKAVSSPLDTLSAEDLKPIALAVWHEDYAPNLNDMELHELQRAGYVVDRLMRFNCVSNDRKRELMGLVKDVKETLPQESLKILVSQNVEPLARKWNLSEDISRAIQALLPYQTRHYNHV